MRFKEGSTLNLTVLIVLALAGGAVIAFINYLLTRKAANSQSKLFSYISIVRMLLSVAYLAAIYFACKHFECDVTWPLVAAVAGMTVPMFLFTFMLVHQLNNEKPKNDKGGEA